MKTFLLKSIENIDQYKNVLFIFDDFISYFKKNEKNTQMMNFFFNRRHLLKKGEISMIITTQRYVIFPITYRTCLTKLIIFRLNDRDYRFIKEDSVGYLQNNKINDLLINDHEFLYINLQEGIIYKNILEKIK